MYISGVNCDYCFSSDHRLPRRPFSHPGLRSQAHAFVISLDITKIISNDIDDDIYTYNQFCPRLPHYCHPGRRAHAHAFVRNGAAVFGLGTLLLYVLVLIQVAGELKN